MQARNIIAIARKDALDMLLNKTTLFFLLAPIMLAVLFAVINGLVANKNASTDILIYNPDNSGVEQFVGKVMVEFPIVHASSALEVANTFGWQGSRPNISYILGVVIPAHFESGVRMGAHPQIQLYVNDTYLGDNSEKLLEHAISDYTRGLTSPQTPLSFAVTTVNLPMTSNYALDYAQRYAMAGLLYSLTIGIAFVPGMLIEEKEKKTLRMLMVSPASWGDIVLSKLLVALVYQILISAAVLIIQGGLIGQVPLLLLFTLLSACFGLMLGLLFGCLCQTNGTLGTFVGLISLAYTLPALVLGPLNAIVQGSPLEQVMKVLPTYYMADSFLKAMQNQASLQNTFLDGAILLGSTVLLFFLAIWALRRQSAVAGAI
ncbi:MAG: ABC transporter permease [Ktedonobacteraceae bacterium]|nr:ABC transporter permease [Ktedonobacteraceae bacterium]